MLSGSRGVIRANSRREFVLAFQRVGALLRDEAAVAPLDELMAAGSSNRCVLVEEFVPGPEMALEGILVDGRLEVLALFDKPDPLDGPFFEETIYVTPSSLSENVRGRASAAVASAAAALGLHDGPIHAEVRLGWAQPVVIEINPRSIGGRCSRILRFGSGMSLEELLLRHALQLPIPSPRLETGAAGVLMIPTPGEGEILGIEGVAAALEVPGITEIDITAHRGQFIRPLPEGSGYLGFVFARAETQEAVISAIEKAHGKLRFRLSSTAAAPRAA
jgi:biotin carboxylase